MRKKSVSYFLLKHMIKKTTIAAEININIVKTQVQLEGKFF